MTHLGSIFLIDIAFTNGIKKNETEEMCLHTYICTCMHVYK